MRLEMALASSMIEPAALHSTFWQGTLLGFNFSRRPGIVAVWFSHP